MPLKAQQLTAMLTFVHTNFPSDVRCMEGVAVECYNTYRGIAMVMHRQIWERNPCICSKRPAQKGFLSGLISSKFKF